MNSLFDLLAQQSVKASGTVPAAAAGGMDTWLDMDGDGWDDYLALGGFFPFLGSAAQSSDQPGWLAFRSAEGVRIATQAEFPGETIGSVHGREILSADFNGDGVTDIFIADHGYDAPPFPGHVNQLFLSNGPGSWRNASSNLPQSPDFSHSAVAADADGDGDIDLFVGNTVLGQAYFLMNDGHGQFMQDRSALPSGNGFDGLYFESCLLVDLDGDALPELVLGSRSPFRAPLVLWNHGGSWAQGDTTALPVPAEISGGSTVLDIQATDVDFDGRPDLLMISHTANGGWMWNVLVNDGDRQFIDRTAEVVPRVGVASGGLNSATVQPSLDFLRPLDLNADGRMDFFTTPAAIRAATPNRDVPVFLVQREDGHFDVVTSGDLLDAGLDPKLLDTFTEYARQGTPGQGDLISRYPDAGGSVLFSSQSLQWADPSSTWHAGTPADDSLTGGSDADWFGPLGGNDQVDGGAGIDRVLFAMPRAEVNLEHSLSGWLASGAGIGLDALAGIERVQFNDAHVALDLDGHAGQVARIIGALLGPASVTNGSYVGVGLELLDSGMGYADLVALVVQTEMFAQLAGGSTDAAFVDHVYRNIVGTSPTPLEAAYFEDLLERGEISQASLALAACETEMNAARIDLTGLAATGLPYVPVQG